MTGGEQDWVAWKPTQAPRQQSVQYIPRKALLLRAPFSTLVHISRPPSCSNAFLHVRVWFMPVTSIQRGVAKVVVAASIPESGRRESGQPRRSGSPCPACVDCCKGIAGCLLHMPAGASMVGLGNSLVASLGLLAEGKAPISSCGGRQCRTVQRMRRCR